jgi:hypothetical protein
MAWMDPATQKQTDLISKLRTERQVDAGVAALLDTFTKGMNRREASSFIDALFALPQLDAPTAPAIVVAPAAPAAAPDRRPIPDVPAGGYALIEGDRTVFYEVDRPTKGRWAGRTFLARMEGDNHSPIRLGNPAQRDEFFRVLEAIAGDLEAAARLYGHRMRRCGFCKLDLTDPYSRFFGVGPVCCRKHDLPFSFHQYLLRHPEQAVDVAAWRAEDAEKQAEREHEADPIRAWAEHKNEFARLERAQEEAAFAADPDFRNFAAPTSL